MNRKLKLDVEDLSVESFRIARPMDEPRGTVRGNSHTEPGSDSYGEDTCGGTSDITAVNCVTEPFGGCSEPGQTWGGTRGIEGAAQGYC
jgi:hypothetical protein